MRMIYFDIDQSTIFRKARPKDIYVGSKVFLIGDDSDLYETSVMEVHRPEDDFKAFTAKDGCRYGLKRLYVLKNDKELFEQNDKLVKTIKDISRLINPYLRYE
jgi:hypothetical protein